MYGLSPQTDLSFLADRELLQVCFGLHQVTLNFECETSVSIESNYFMNGVSRDRAALCSLLGHRVSAARNVGDGSVDLVFSSGDRLYILDSNKDYESYQIVAPGIQIIV
jgi:hypothetical protein